MTMPATQVRWVKPPTMTLADKLYLPAIVAGLGTTLRHVFQKSVTQQFPEERPKLPPNYRGVHRLNRDEDGRVRCVACYMCATVCPAHCIDIVAAPAPADWKDREKYPETFVIDKAGIVRWKVVNPIPQARDIADYQKALAALA